jgi:hypothetical protein
MALLLKLFRSDRWERNICSAQSQTRRIPAFRIAQRIPFSAYGHGRLAGAGVSINLAAGQSVEDIEMMLTTSGVIPAESGTKTAILWGLRRFKPWSLCIRMGSVF